MLYVILFSLLAAIADLSGLLLFWKKGWASRYTNLLVSFAAGALLGAAFLELLPETIEHGGHLAWVLGGFLLFYLSERVLFLYHCHDDSCEVHTSSVLMLIGNTLHDFGDGVIIALTFLADPHLGLMTTIAVIAHEFPSGIGEFGVLLHGGVKAAQAFLYTLLSILATPLGALVTLILSDKVEAFMGTLLAVAAGGFIYIAAVDLIPETHKALERKRSLIQIIMFGLGVLVIWVTGQFLGHH